MTDERPEISILDARLAEIDRRLSSIQTGLADDISIARRERPTGQAAPPAPALPPRVEVAQPPAPLPLPLPTPTPTPIPTLERVLGELRSLADAHERLLLTTRELLSAFEHVLRRLTEAETDRPAVRQFSVSAGPFSSTEALRGFEQTLSHIPAVREVSVRAYEGEDRAIVDVHLFEPNT